MRSALIAFVMPLAISACGTVQGQPAGVSVALEVQEEAAITAMLEAQDAAWNRGDIPAFMDGYWKSPDLRFASGGNIARGWDATLHRYETRYDTPEKMGTLVTSDYEIEILSPDAAIAHGHWMLEVEGDNPSGLYTLVLRKIDGGWVIISDTTTSAD
ncbi:YybH family protein [Hyphomonas sp. UBA3601]|uniref:YybH family protein n=1 Tax=Hyphomonas sp. UBA3601 TaxID=1946626 RepID=UPI0025BD06BB|nr:nuclear transport factor 2 family protein [Hyphomonas sp. UBA3601]|tara:strand:- start:5037 stop:5507 length:471 start_codon:yes stop_codon:yes gene_type:complete